MVSMYPNSQPMAYTVDNGVFTPCPPASNAGSSSCPPCNMKECTALSLALKRLGFNKFSKIVEKSGLRHIEDEHGLTLFVPGDADIPDETMSDIDKHAAVNIVKASSMPRMIPLKVLGQRALATYRSLHKIYKLKIVCDEKSVRVAIDTLDKNYSNMLKADIKDAYNTSIIVHQIDNLLKPDCML